MTEETQVNCPYCGEDFTTVVDCSTDDQVYIEDCFVCCRPISFHIRAVDGELESAETRRSD